MDFITWTTGERFLADGELIRRRIGAKADIDLFPAPHEPADYQRVFSFGPTFGPTFSPNLSLGVSDLAKKLGFLEHCQQVVRLRNVDLLHQYGDIASRQHRIIRIFHRSTASSGSH